jgi:hypothetical protein
MLLFILNLLKYTLGLPFLFVMTCFMIFFHFILYPVLVLPLSNNNEIKEYYKDIPNLFKKLWSPIS